MLVEVRVLDQLSGEGGSLFSKYPLWTPSFLPILKVIVKPYAAEKFWVKLLIMILWSVGFKSALAMLLAEYQNFWVLF